MPYTLLAIVVGALLGAWLYSSRRVVPMLTSSETSEWPTEPGDISPLPPVVAAPTSVWRARVVDAANTFATNTEAIESRYPGYSGERKTFVYRIRNEAPTATRAVIRTLLLGAYPFPAYGASRNSELRVAMDGYNASRAALVAALDAPDLVVYSLPSREVFRA